jgi:putative acetyltransferase
MPEADIVIREERPEDRPAVEDVVARAFGQAEVAELVGRIRSSAGFVPELSLVAEEAGAVVGHVMLSHLDLEDHGGIRHRVLTLSPLSVVPERQRRGIGGSLIRAAIERADEREEPLIVLEGSPAYYPRFGFRHSVPFGIRIHLPSWAPPEAAMVLPLRGYRPEIRGTVVYPPAFDVVVEDRPDADQP